MWTELDTGLTKKSTVVKKSAVKKPATINTKPNAAEITPKKDEALNMSAKKEEQAPIEEPKSALQR